MTQESIKTATEKEMREGKVPTFDTLPELMEYVEALTTREHDYGTCCYAMSMAATAAFNYVARQLGVSGFQASCADMDVLRRTRGLSHGFLIVDFEKLLYPQYRDNVLGFDDLLAKNAEHLAPIARQKLAEAPNAHPNVLAHWRLVAELLRVPPDAVVESQS